MHQPRPPTSFLIVGCGYTGSRLLPRLAALAPTLATTSSPASAAALTACDFPAVAWNLDVDSVAPFPAAAIAGGTLIYLAPPPRGGTTDPRLKRCLDGLPATPARVVYVSTIGVYGDAGGAVVNEDTPPAPATGRARRRLDAETRLRSWCEAHQVEWVILRAPAIYGPGRLPLARLRRGEAVLAESEAGPANRIHVDDLAAACLAAATGSQACGRIYNVGDGNPLSSPAFATLVARLAGLPAPPQLPKKEFALQRSPMALSFMAESRRADTTRMQSELNVELRYADPEDGIRASLAASPDATRR